MTGPAIRIYGTWRCGYCAAARELLRERGAVWLDIDVDSVPGARDEMMRLSGRRTVPQIFIGDRHVGGYDDLVELDRAGGLDPLLAAMSTPAKESPHE